MKWYAKSPYTQFKENLQWHPWFAWHPVRIGDYRYWMTKVERKVSITPFSYEWEYREMK